MQIKAQQSLQVAVDLFFQFIFCLTSTGRSASSLVITESTLVSLPLVRARVLVVLLIARTREVMRSAERSQSAPIRACVMVSVPSAQPRSPRPTSLPAMERPKFASMGWVAEDFRPGRTGCYSNFIFIPASVWSCLSPCSSPAGLLRLHLWEVWSWGVHLCQPRW